MLPIDGRPPALKRCVALAAVMLISARAAEAGLVETLDGSRLVGRVDKVTDSEVVISTDFAGTLTLQRDKVAVIESPEPVTVKLGDGTTVTGALSVDPEGALRLSNDMLSLSTSSDKVAAVWKPDATPPPESGYVPPRAWAYQIGIDLSGRDGNSEELATNVTADARLISQNDELHLYSTIEKAERNNQDTADEIIAGATYTSYFSDPWGWYVNTEIERDEFEDLELRSKVAGGISYRLINRDVQRLKLMGGFGYRYESFNDGTTDSSPTIEFGVDHWYRLRDWLEMNNRLTFAPAVNDFQDFLAIHDSGFVLPIGNSQRWKLRLGVRNDYNNIPAMGRESLDTSYYLRMLLDL